MIRCAEVCYHCKYLRWVETHEDAIPNPNPIGSQIVRGSRSWIGKDVEDLVVRAVPSQLSSAALLDAVITTAARNGNLH
jgi:hypothetical protein